MSPSPFRTGPLATTVVGSLPIPRWLSRLKTDRHQGRISPAALEEAHNTAVKAALKDQELAGLDFVSDGELRRDNDIDWFLERIPSVELRNCKHQYSEYYEAVARSPLGSSSQLGLVDGYMFAQERTPRPVKVTLTGPFSLGWRVVNDAYPSREELTMALVPHLRAEAARLVAAGARFLQIDEPYLAGRPDEVELAVRAINELTDGVDAHWSLHVCYGNRHARPIWEGHYDFLLPVLPELGVQRLMLEFARKDFSELDLIGKIPSHLEVGIGVLQVRSDAVETSSEIAAHIRAALKMVSPERAAINPDCGLRRLSEDVAWRKLLAMCEAVNVVREELGITGPEGTGEESES